MESKTLIRYLAICTIFTCMGCGLFKQVKPLQIDQSPDFDGQQILSGGIAIGAVVSFHPDSLAQETSRDALAASLQSKLLESHPDLIVLPPSRVQAGLGDSVYEAWVQEFEISGHVREEAITRISVDTQNFAGYLVMARISLDEISTSEEGNYVYDNNSSTTIRDGSIYSMIRKTRMLISVYECKTASLKWKGQFEATSRTRRAVTESEEAEHSQFDPVGDIASSVLDAVIGSPPKDPNEAYWPYRAPTPIGIQVDKIYKEFLKALLPPENS